MCSVMKVGAKFIEESRDTMFIGNVESTALGDGCGDLAILQARGIESTRGSEVTAQTTTAKTAFIEKSAKWKMMVEERNELRFRVYIEKVQTYEVGERKCFRCQDRQ